MATWLDDMTKLLGEVERKDTPAGSINTAPYLAAMDNISVVCGGPSEEEPGHHAAAGLASSRPAGWRGLQSPHRPAWRPAAPPRTRPPP